MPDYRITAIRPDGHDTDRLIDALLIEGTVWPIDKVIDWIRSGTHVFWVDAAGRRVKVIVGRRRHSDRTFLTTEGEGFPPERLLALRHIR